MSNTVKDKLVEKIMESEDSYADLFDRLGLCYDEVLGQAIEACLDSMTLDQLLEEL